MSEPKHTPGPWSVEGKGGQSRGGSIKEWPCFMGSIKGWKGQPIVQQSCLLGVQGATPEEAEANAHLISAAPDYHAAAVALVARHDKKAKRVNFDLCGCEGCESFRPIIAKAIGDK